MKYFFGCLLDQMSAEGLKLGLLNASDQAVFEVVWFEAADV